MKQIILSAACIVLFSSAGIAEDVAQGWSGETSLSGSKTTGNTNSTDIGLAIHLVNKSGPWTSKFDTTYDLGTANGFDNKKRWIISYQLNRQINDRLYALGNVSYFSDEFGPFKQGSFAGAGLGFDAIKTGTAEWAVETGVGYRSQKTRESGIIFPVKQDEVAFRGSSQFTYKFNEQVSFFNKSELIWSDSDTYVWNDTGITANIAGNLAARFNFRVDYHSTVPLGIKNTDTITRGALVYTLQ